MNPSYNKYIEEMQKFVVLKSGEKESIAQTGEDTVLNSI